VKTHDKTREKRFKCQKCSFYQTDKADHLRSHLKYHEKLDEDLKKWPNAFQCEKDNCLRIFKDLICYKRHLKNIHENPKITKCEVCGLKVKNKRYLKNHKQVEHGLELKM
jgi:hypothetical protein